MTARPQKTWRMSYWGIAEGDARFPWVQDIPWPLTMIPSTAFTPIPMQIIVPPLLELLPIIKQAAIIASSMVA